MTETIGKDIRTIIWDLDGTLLDSFGVYEEALGILAPKYGLDVPSRELILANYHGSLQDSMSGALGGLQGERLEAIIKEFLVIQDTQYSVIEGHLFRDAEGLVARAHTKGIEQLLVTNRDHEGRNNASPRSIVLNSELRNYIDKVICGDDSQHRKPKPEVLGHRLSSLDLEATLVIGDQFVDAQFALNLGSRALIVCRDAEQPANMSLLDEGWEDHITIVGTLSDVEV